MPTKISKGYGPKLTVVTGHIDNMYLSSSIPILTLSHHHMIVLQSEAQRLSNLLNVSKLLGHEPDSQIQAI